METQPNDGADRVANLPTNDSELPEQANKVSETLKEASIAADIHNPSPTA